MSHAPRDILDRHALEIIVLLSVVALALTPPFAIAATGQLSMLIGAPLIFAMRPQGRLRLRRPEIIMLAVMMLVVVMLLGMSLAAVNPAVSFLGKAGQHTGASMWLAMSMVFVAVLARPRPGDVGRVARGIGIAGAVLGVAALLDRAGLIDSLRFSPEPAGLLESSATLGQALVVALAASVAWAITSRKPGMRYSAWGAALVCAAAIGVSGARSAVVAVAVAALAIWLGLRAGKSGRLTARSVGVGMAVLALLGAAGIWFYIGTGDGSRAVELAEVTNNRSVIWETAIVRTEQRIVLGNGADQFSAFVTWDASPDGRGITRTGTYDPHNVLLYWLVSIGLVGFAVACVAIGLVWERLWALLAARGYSLSLAVLIGGVLAWSIVILFMWVSSVAALMVAVLTASLIAAGQATRGDAETGGTALGWGAVAFVAIAAAATMLIWWVPLGAEFGWGRSMAEGTLTAQKSMELSQRSQSPAAGAVTVGGMLSEAAKRPEARPFLLADAGELVPALEPDAVWHVDAAYAGFQYEVAQLLWVETGDWTGLERYLEAGLKADPTSGIWYYSAAVYADELGSEARAAEYAGKALEFPLSDAAVAFCEQVINRAGGIAPGRNE